MVTLRTHYSYTMVWTLVMSVCNVQQQILSIELYYHHTLDIITPSLLSHPHYHHTLDIITPSLLSHPQYYHTLNIITPSLLSHPHYCHTLTIITPSLLSHPHYYHTLTIVTPSLLSHPHYYHTLSRALISTLTITLSRQCRAPFLCSSSSYETRTAPSSGVTLLLLRVGWRSLLACLPQEELKLWTIGRWAVPLGCYTSPSCPRPWSPRQYTRPSLLLGHHVAVCHC